MYVVTANRVLDGIPVYIDNNGHWVTDPNRSKLFEEKTDAAKAVESAKYDEQIVCDPLSTRADMIDGKIQFKGTKFTIRSDGPNVMLASIGLSRAGLPQTLTAGGC